MDPAFSIPLGVRSDRRTGHKVLGLRLRPLTVGHLFLLLEIGNAFPDRPRESDHSDVASAALICSQPHRSARRLINSRFYPIVGKLWARLMRKCDLAREQVAFLDYLLEQLQRPESDSQGPAGELRAPTAWRLLAMLTADFHYRPPAAPRSWLSSWLPARKDVLDVEVSYALTLWAVESDRRGFGKLASRRQIIFRQWVRDMEAMRLSAKGGS